jgi:hypothetical protein
MKKVSKEDLYIYLTKTYNWTPNEIANLNPHQQLIYFRGPTIQQFDTHEEFLAWQSSRK